ncbi:trihelix transcription factor DF1-like [Amaranthus tricolor]|uniref:trihelix transcription factor DF1-like n=1 Tax=Amaranthus tricolor TaxID=29722 RepID=UPI00258F76CB|nr:trihelix transcription factor DF1-like [Amaranthus tricolor]
MLGTSNTLLGSSGDDSGGGSGGGGGKGEVSGVGPTIMTAMGDEDKGISGADLFEGDRSTGGNRWPRQETLALLKIRSDMDGVFRDSSLKGPLWEEVSRKMGELGYHRSAKKCKEKFENVYKYHKRTKDGRVGKSDGKTYRFFDQLEALEQHHLSLPTPLPQQSGPHVTPRAAAQMSQAPPQAAVPVTMVIPAGTNPANITVTVPSSPHHNIPISVSSINPSQQQMNLVQQQHNPAMAIPTHSSIQMENASSPSATQSSSSSTSSDEELLGRRKRKRKWKDFFERLMKEVIDKQEELQKKFLEAVEKREHDRAAREEGWKMQEMARLNREHDILVQERSMAAAKDAALIAFLQKLSDQQQIPLPVPIQAQTHTQTQTHTQPESQAQSQAQIRLAVPAVAPPITTTQPQSVSISPQPLQQLMPQPPPPRPQPQPQHKIQAQEIPVTLPSPTQPQSMNQLQQQAIVVVEKMNNNGDNVELQKGNNGDKDNLQASSSRWPKAEVQALINLRTSLDQKYQENGPKGPLWEEISSSMKKLGYNRNAKRCKEKWENINKYFKKVKESNKKRPEDSKTCPYFHQLDALYRERNKMEMNSPNPAVPMAISYGQQQMKNNEAPIMAEPEQQWPPIHHGDQTMEEPGSDTEDDGDDEEDDDQGNGYEIVANNIVNAGSMNTPTTASRTATAE